MNLPGPLSRKQQATIAVAVVVAGAVAVLLVSGVLSVSLQMMGPTGETPPQGSFHVNGGEDVTITRDVGQPVDAAKLQIRVNEEARGSWRELADGTESVEVGDSVTISGVTEGDVVSLYWTGGNVSQKLVGKHV